LKYARHEKDLGSNLDNPWHVEPKEGAFACPHCVNHLLKAVAYYWLTTMHEHYVDSGMCTLSTLYGLGNSSSSWSQSKICTQWVSKKYSLREKWNVNTEVRVILVEFYVRL